MTDVSVLYKLERTFKKIGIRSTISMLQSEKRQHVLKMMELEHNGDRTSTQIKERCANYIDYIIGEIAQLQQELKDLDYER